MNGFTDAPSIKPNHAHGTWLELFWSKFNWTVHFLLAVFRFRFIACIQIQSFNGRFILLHLSTLPRSDFPGSHGAKKHYRLVLFWARVLESFYFLMFSFMACANLATSPKRLETELTNITGRHFCSFPVFCIEHSFIYFIYFLLSEFFPLFVCFDILWQLATVQARDSTRDRDANSSRKWRHLVRFFAGETSWALALSLAFAAENIKNLPLGLRAREQISARLVGKSNSTTTRTANLVPVKRENWMAV